jgi:hypothetical protein
VDSAGDRNASIRETYWKTQEERGKKKAGKEKASSQKSQCHTNSKQ